jgi:hypothetical protein
LARAFAAREEAREAVGSAERTVRDVMRAQLARELSHRQPALINREHGD